MSRRKKTTSKKKPTGPTVTQPIKKHSPPTAGNNLDPSLAAAIKTAEDLVGTTHSVWFGRILRTATSKSNTHRILDSDLNLFLEFYETIIVTHDNLLRFRPSHLATLEDSIRQIREPIFRKQAFAQQKSKIEALERLYDMTKHPWVGVLPGGLPGSGN